MKSKPSILLAIAVMGAITSTAGAVTVLYSTGFDAPDYTNAALVGQDGWLQTATTATNPITVANTETNGTVTMGTSGQDIYRAFTPVTSSGSIYLSASFTVGAAQAGGDYFLHFGDASTSAFFARLYVKSSEAGYLMGISSSSGVVNYGTTVLAFNSPVEVLMRYDFVLGAANDTSALFLNPTTDDGSDDTAYITAVTNATAADAASISTVRLRQGAAGSAPTVAITGLSVAVPEPSAAMLLGAFGLLGILRRRR